MRVCENFFVIKALLGGTIKEMMETEIDEQLGYEKSERSDNDVRTLKQSIYQAPTEEKALDAMERVTEKWSKKYSSSIRNWKQNWDAISPIFKFSTTVRKVIYTTNAIENLNATYRKLNRQRSVLPSDTALLKALYLSTFEATKKLMPISNWGQVYGELSIIYEGWLPE